MEEFAIEVLATEELATDALLKLLAIEPMTWNLGPGTRFAACSECDRKLTVLQPSLCLCIHSERQVPWDSQQQGGFPSQGIPKKGDYTRCPMSHVVWPWQGELF